MILQLRPFVDLLDDRFVLPLSGWRTARRTEGFYERIKLGWFSRNEELRRRGIDPGINRDESRMLTLQPPQDPEQRHRIHHSSLAQGAPVAGAGDIQIQNGRLTDIRPISGHYKPNDGFTAQAVRQLWRAGVDMNAANIMLGHGFSVHKNLQKEFDQSGPTGAPRAPRAWEQLLGYGPRFTAKGGNIFDDMKKHRDHREKVLETISDMGQDRDLKQNKQLVPSLVKAAQDSTSSDSDSGTGSSSGTDSESDADPGEQKQESAQSLSESSDTEKGTKRIPRDKRGPIEIMKKSHPFADLYD